MHTRTRSDANGLAPGVNSNSVTGEPFSARSSGVPPDVPRKPRRFNGDADAERDWIASLYVCRSFVYPRTTPDLRGFR